MRGRLVVCVALLCAALPAAAYAAASWNSGTLVESTITDCGSIIAMNPTPVTGLGTYASVYEDYNNPPPANQGYYIAIDVYGIGNACGGQAVDIAVSLPANTQLNISAATPVHCVPLLTQNNQIVNGPPDTSAGCPQAAAAGSNNPYYFRMGANTGFFGTTFYPFWGIAIGLGVELQMPVVSSAAVTAPNNIVTGVIQVADGNSNPTLRPTIPVTVGPASMVPPTQGTAYAVNNPSASDVTNNSASLSATFVIDHNINPSSVEFLWGTTATYDFGLSQSLDYVAGQIPYEDQRGFSLTGLAPGCTYHWLARLNAGATHLATTPDQTFTTTGTFNGSCAFGPGGGNGFHSGPIQKVQPLNPLTTLPVKFTPPPPAPTPPTTPTTTVTTPTTPTTTTTTPVNPPGPTDRVTKLSLPSKTITSGSALTVQVSLAAAGKVTVTIVRHVPASGHGKHRRKAHDVTVGTKTFSGKVGVNKLKLTTIKGHRLAVGRYTAKVTSGGKSHSISFTVKAKPKRRHHR